MAPDVETSPDPIHQSSLREAKWICLIWLINFIWVVGYCVSFGYASDGDQEPLATIVGMPTWVFWGVFAPWILAAAVSAWFALTQMEDHPLNDPTEAAATPASRLNAAGTEEADGK